MTESWSILKKLIIIFLAVARKLIYARIHRDVHASSFYQVCNSHTCTLYFLGSVRHKTKEKTHLIKGGHIEDALWQDFCFLR